MPENFEIANLWVFYLLPLPLLVYWLFPPLRRKTSSLNLPTYEKAIHYTGERPRGGALIKKMGWLRALVLSICWFLILAALSSPQIVGEPEYKVKTSRSFLVVADISFSMAQKDWISGGERVRRWDAVKEVMHEFIQGREGDRMGLIFFGTNAYIQAPFTSDLTTVDQLLEEADVGMAGQMTNIGKAITKGADLFQRDTIQSKVMLLLTDGVDSGTDILPLDAAELAKEDSIMIYTLGIGIPGSSGSDLDERSLQRIADMTGGKYFLAENKEMLQDVYAELDLLEPIEYEELENRPISLLYYYPLGLALGILMLFTLILSFTEMYQRAGKEEQYV